MKVSGHCNLFQRNQQMCNGYACGKQRRSYHHLEGARNGASSLGNFASTECARIDTSRIHLQTTTNAQTEGSVQTGTQAQSHAHTHTQIELHACLGVCEQSGDDTHQPRLHCKQSITTHISNKVEAGGELHVDHLECHVDLAVAALQRASDLAILHWEIHTTRCHIHTRTRSGDNATAHTEIQRKREAEVKPFVCKTWTQFATVAKLQPHTDTHTHA